MSGPRFWTPLWSLLPAFELETAGMKDRLGIARWLGTPVEHKVASGVKRDPVEARRHWVIGRITRILPVDDLGHAHHHVGHLLLRHDTMM